MLPCYLPTATAKHINTANATLTPLPTQKLYKPYSANLHSALGNRMYLLSLILAPYPHSLSPLHFQLLLLSFFFWRERDHKIKNLYSRAAIVILIARAQPFLWKEYLCRYLLGLPWLILSNSSGLPARRLCAINRKTQCRERTVA